MSLTSELQSKNSFVRRFIDAEFPHLQELSKQINSSLKRYESDLHQLYPKTVLYMLAGTAMDYRIRIFFSNSPHKEGALAAGLKLIKGATTSGLENPWHAQDRRRDYISISDKVIFSFEQFVRENRPTRRLLAREKEERLCQYCVLFALIDFFSRLSPGAFEYLIEIGSHNINSMLKRMDKNVVKDVMSLSSSFYSQNKKLLKSFSKVHLGKSLAGSKDVAGADFDLVVDGCLFEIKTTIKPKITTAFLRQLIGYFLLDYIDEFKMRKAFIQLTRQGHTLSFDIRKDLLRSDCSLQQIRESFQNGIRANKSSRKLKTQRLSNPSTLSSV